MNRSKILILAGQMFFSFFLMVYSAEAREWLTCFRSVPVEYDSKTGLLLYSEFGLDLKVIEKDPKIIRRENDEGVEIIFQKQGRDLVKVLMPFTYKTQDELLPDKVTYEGRTATALAQFSLQVAPKSKKELCEYASDLSKFQKMLKTGTNRIFPSNSGGFVGMGLCWWHSRLERKATYLTFYSPDKAKPSRKEAIRLLRKIRAGQEIVEIPGYSNLSDFTKDFSDEVIRNLSYWQMSDSAIQQVWTQGLKGRPEVSSQELRDIMDSIYDLVEKEKRIAYIMLQASGFGAHSLLVVGMKRTEDGYILQTADSNYNGQIHLVKYQEGMTQLKYEGKSTKTRYFYVPYLMKAPLTENEETLEVLKRECQK